MSTTNIHEFRGNIAQAAEKLKLTYKQVFRKVAFDLLGQIQTRTPVDTGRARANWFMTEGGPSGQTIGWPGTKGDSFSPPSPPSLEISGERDVFIVNNLPYIKPLEEGHSQQAPNGMVRLAMENVKASINRIAKSE